MHLGATPKPLEYSTSTTLMIWNLKSQITDDYSHFKEGYLPIQVIRESERRIPIKGGIALLAHTPGTHNSFILSSYGNFLLTLNIQIPFPNTHSNAKKKSNTTLSGTAISYREQRRSSMNYPQQQQENEPQQQPSINAHHHSLKPSISLNHNATIPIITILRKRIAT